MTRTSHVGVHASTPAVGVAVPGVPGVRVTVTPMGVAVTSVAVLAVVRVSVVRMAVVVRRAALASVRVGVAESADAHQVDQQTSDRHRLQW